MEEPSPGGGKAVASFWSASPKFRNALKAGGGFMLIVTAVVICIGRMILDSAETEHGGKIGKPGIYAVGMLVAFYTLPVLAFVVPLLGLACVVRCKSIFVGFVTSVVALIAVVFVARPFKLFLPTIFLGRLTETSLGYYIGATIQFGLGAWLMGWFDKWLKPAQPPKVCEINTEEQAEDVN